MSKEAVTPVSNASEAPHTQRSSSVASFLGASGLQCGSAPGRWSVGAKLRFVAVLALVTLASIMVGLILANCLPPIYNVGTEKPYPLYLVKPLWCVSLIGVVLLLSRGHRRVALSLFVISTTGASYAKTGPFFPDFNIQSPISLIWQEGADIEDFATCSRFPIDPSHPASSWLWRGSAQTPLLVRVADGRSEVLDGTQLFGNFTAGKNWRDGYEALASFDTDKTGWLEGAELTGIALWFDGDQNGIAEAREIRSLAEVGVVAIGVEPDSRDSRGAPGNPGYILATRGYKRIANGQQVLGRSVAWSSRVLQPD